MALKKIISRLAVTAAANPEQAKRYLESLGLTVGKQLKGTTYHEGENVIAFDGVYVAGQNAFDTAVAILRRKLGPTNAPSGKFRKAWRIHGKGDINVEAGPGGSGVTFYLYNA